MIIRSLLRAQASRMAIQRGLRPSKPSMHTTKRYASAQASSTASPAPQSQASMLSIITADLDKIAPRFEIPSEDIQIIQTPAEFYNILKDKMLKAQDRIYLSTLYIGPAEHEFISTIRIALINNPDLHVSFLTDALRGTRETPNPSNASLVVPLISEFGSERVEVRMYHTPNLNGLKKKYIPKRFNEGWGLQHMKLYGIDDEIIISGANLSSDYFTNRQDRYHLFRSKALTDYFAKIHSSIANLSFDLQPSNTLSAGSYTLTWPPSNPAPSPLDAPKEYRHAAQKHLSHLLTPSNSPPHASPQSKTTIYPILSLVPLLPSSTELPALTSILTHLTCSPLTRSAWTFTAGYFNMTPSFRRLLLATHPAHGTVLTAHPHANGFYGSAGVSGMLPDAYTHMAKMFLRKARNDGLTDSIALREWKRGTVGEKDGWTYHAKGIWVSFPSSSSLSSSSGMESAEEDPSLTVVGSSNYTKRSYELDLEANVIIATSDLGLRKRLGEEVRWLNEYATTVEESEFEKKERKVSLSVKLSMWLVRVLGGAL